MVSKNKKKSTKAVAVTPQVQLSHYETSLDPQRLREARLRTLRRNIVVTDAIRDELIERMTAGELPTDVCMSDHMPDWGTLRKELARDEAFKARYYDALAAMADAKLADANAMLDQAIRNKADGGDPFSVDVKAVEIYTKSLVHQLEKLAPKSHGNLLKLGDSNAAPLSITVMRFGEKEKIEKQ